MQLPPPFYHLYQGCAEITLKILGNGAEIG